MGTNNATNNTEQIAANSIRGNNTGSTALGLDLTVAQTNTLLATGSPLSSGWKTGIAAVPAASAYDSAGTTLTANAFTKINLGTENFDIGSYFSGSRFTPLVSGIYQVSFSMGLTTTNIDVTKEYNAVLYKSGANYRYGSFSTPSTSIGICSNGSCLVSMNGTTDYLELWGENTNAATTVSTNNSNLLTYLDAHYVGPLT